MKSFIAALRALIEVVEAKGVAIRFVTRCSSAEEFIERFARFATETDIVVPALADVSAGTERPFAILLKDGAVVMKGRGEVTEVRPAAAAPGAAPIAPGYALMRLRLREMDAHSWGIHLRLMERHASPSTTTTEVSAVTAVGGPPSPSGPERRAVSPVPRPETRVPGAGSTLPANLLSDLDAADLASFVELTLLESNAGVDAAEVAGGELGGGAQADDEPTLVALPAPAARSGTRLADARRIARRGAPYASCVIVGLLFGIALRPGTKAAPVVCPPNPAPPPVITPPSTASVPEDEPPILAPRDCIARVRTKPAGAEVSWGDIALGPSPIERAAIPCGSAIVTFRREHYAEVTRTITTERGRRAVVAQRLERPSAKVVVTSSPPHAVIKLNKHRLGHAPREIDTLRFERVRIEASLPGYRPWKKTLYLDEAESQVDVTLVRRSSLKVDGDRRGRRSTRRRTAR